MPPAVTSPVVPRRTARRASVRVPAVLAAVFAAAFTLVSGPAAAADQGWPRVITAPNGTRVLLYQPQPEERLDNILTGRAAVSITPKGITEPTFGTVWIRARMEIDREKREVTFADITVPRARFPGSTEEQEAKLSALLEKEIPKWDVSISLDRLLVSLEAVEKEKLEAEKFNETPPKIVFRSKPTLLVLIDGEAILRDVPGSDVKRVINTPYFLVFDGEEYWLNGNAAWFRTKDGNLKGAWDATKKPSKAVGEYHDKAIPKEPKGTPAKPPEKTKAPEILVSTEPTELIVTDGDPKFAPITETDLLYVTNTKSNVFVGIDDQMHYVLLSGRWFRAVTLDGPWTFVKSDALPVDFKRIPEKSPKGEVLASVAGTPQAEEAVIDAQVPQTAAIKRTVTRDKVEYDGEPKFEPIEGTTLAYAVNTTAQVIRSGNAYYLCDQAVWFVAETPQGPFKVADTIPAEIQKIPPDHPGYNTKYVHVYDSTPEVVYVGYTPGYVGCYPWYGTVVWGTGWYYPPYVSPLVYYPHPVTYGVSAVYSPYGGWAFGIGIAYGAFSISFWGGGMYGGYWGPVYRPPAYYPGWGGGGYYPSRPVGGGGANIGARPTPYGTNDNLYARDGNRARNAPSNRPAAASRPATQPNTPNNVMSDRDGNVARRGADGSWQSRDGGAWKSGTGGAGVSSLERDYQARQRGAARAQSFSGGFRGGGGGRRR